MSSSAFAPSASTIAMSSDRGTMGKLIGHLYLASKMLREGTVCTMEDVRHEIRTLLNTGRINMNSGLTDDPDTNEAASLDSWTRLLGKVFMETRKLSDSSDCLPDKLKQDLARAIKKGKMLAGGGSDSASQAQTEIKKAAQLYHKLSGASYL